jgi:hypothetical protein
MTNENGFTAPLDRDGLARIDISQIKLGGCESEDVSRGAHGRNEFDNENTGGGCVGKADSGEHEVGEGTTLGFGYFVNPVRSVRVIYGSEFMKGLLRVTAAAADCGEERWGNYLIGMSLRKS